MGVYCITFTLPKQPVNIQLLGLISNIIHLSHSIIYIIQNNTLLQSNFGKEQERGEGVGVAITYLHLSPSWTCRRGFVLPQATTQI